MSQILTLACVAMAGAALGCDDDAPDGGGLVIEVLADQPRSADLGVSLAVHARGGAGVLVSVEQGTLVVAGADQPPSASASRCLSSGSTQALVDVALSVRPVDEEALLFATLFTASDCTGDRIQSRVVAVRPPAVNQVPVDAGAARAVR